MQRWAGACTDYDVDSRMGKGGWQGKGTSGPRDGERKETEEEKSGLLLMTSTEKPVQIKKK